MNPSALTSTPWDTAAFGLATYELADASAASLHQAVQTPGHHSVRVDPLASKQLLHEYGFYYCDTLIEPYCAAAKLKVPTHPDISIGKHVDWQELLRICHGAFLHGRFHRDFNLDQAHADLRYDNWLRQLCGQQHVYGLFWRNELAGFIAYSGNSLVLHAVDEACRGKGLSKYWWGAVCAELFAAGCAEVKSSISASNMAALNLYVSLGFSFRNPVDIYHRLVK
ncbi:MAG: GNAT family N-acetyltransferase [Gallionellaceae bacterium]|nr:GNAT family N-acetyltransferase [Gallionellaceae bacterium]